MTEKLHDHQDDTKAKPAGDSGDKPATPAKNETKVTGGSAEQAEGQLNPSAPGNTGTTPGTNAKLG